MKIVVRLWNELSWFWYEQKFLILTILALSLLADFLVYGFNLYLIIALLVFIVILGLEFIFS